VIKTAFLAAFPPLLTYNVRQCSRLWFAKTLRYIINGLLSAGVSSAVCNCKVIRWTEDARRYVDPTKAVSLWSAKTPVNSITAQCSIVTSGSPWVTRLSFLLLKVVDFKGVQAG